MFIEGLRTDSLYVGVFRISQVIGFCCFAIGTALLIYGFIKAKKIAYDKQDYVPVYPHFNNKNKQTTMSSTQIIDADEKNIGETLKEEGDKENDN